MRATELREALRAEGLLHSAGNPQPSEPQPSPTPEMGPSLARRRPLTPESAACNWSCPGPGSKTFSAAGTPPSDRNCRSCRIAACALTDFRHDPPTVPYNRD